MAEGTGEVDVEATGVREDEGERGRVDGPAGWSEGDRGGREADDCREREPAILFSSSQRKLERWARRVGKRRRPREVALQPVQECRVRTSGHFVFSRAESSSDSVDCRRRMTRYNNPRNPASIEPPTPPRPLRPGLSSAYAQLDRDRSANALSMQFLICTVGTELVCGSGAGLQDKQLDAPRGS